MAQASVLTDNDIRRVFRIIETSCHAITPVFYRTLVASGPQSREPTMPPHSL